MSKFPTLTVIQKMALEFDRRTIQLFELCSIEILQNFKETCPKENL